MASEILEQHDIVINSKAWMITLEARDTNPPRWKIYRVHEDGGLSPNLRSWPSLKEAFDKLYVLNLSH